MDRRYWLDLFTGKTWEEFLKNGANITGFKERRRNIATKIQSGDYLLCYLTGLSRFIGVLEVLSESFIDKTPIWEDQIFPVRFKVRVVYALDAKTAVPVHDLRDKLSLFERGKKLRSWSGFFRGSPAQFDPHDGEVIVEAIKNAYVNPIAREFDERKYWRRPRVYESPVGEVTVPETEEEIVSDDTREEPGRTTHEEMQWLLLKLGSDMGLDVWVARNDRNKRYGGTVFTSIAKLREDLPRQFDEATNRTIELIDVLWLRRDAIIAAFEVEHTSSIYSGLLRMSDLISMQPNINIKLYIFAPDDRSDKVIAEVNRPTFARLNPPLPKICKFIPYSQLKKEIEQVGYRVRYMKPEFIDEIAESCETGDI